MQKLNINTPEGWTIYAEATNRKSFISTFGREPIDSNEVTAWVNAAVAEANRLYPTDEQKPEPQLRTVAGQRYWVTTF